MPSSFNPKIWKLIDYISKDCEKMAHTAQFLLCLVQEENDKVFCTKYSGHVQTQEALPTFNSNDVKPWDLYLSTNLFQIMLSSDTLFSFYVNIVLPQKNNFPPSL